MKSITKRTLYIALASVLVISTTGAVFARGGFDPGWGGHQMMMSGPQWGYTPATAEQRLQELKGALNITSEQESTWTAYADAVKSKVAMRAAHQQAMHGLTPVSWEQRQAFHKQGKEQMQNFSTASNNLNSVLTPEQRDDVREVAGTFNRPCVYR